MRIQVANEQYFQTIEPQTEETRRVEIFLASIDDDDEEVKSRHSIE